MLWQCAVLKNSLNSYCTWWVNRSLAQILTQCYALCMKYISLPVTQHKPLYHLGHDKFSQCYNCVNIWGFVSFLLWKFLTILFWITMKKKFIINNFLKQILSVQAKLIQCWTLCFTSVWNCLLLLNLFLSNFGLNQLSKALILKTKQFIFNSQALFWSFEPQ